MPISKKHKIIFVHIPKNAGTYVESQLFFSGKNRAFLNDTPDHDLLIGKNLQHLSYRDLCLLSLSTDTTGYQAFAVYRHPASRLASILNYTYIPYVKKKLNATSTSYAKTLSLLLFACIRLYAMLLETLGINFIPLKTQSTLLIHTLSQSYYCTSYSCHVFPPIPLQLIDISQVNSFLESLGCTLTLNGKNASSEHFFSKKSLYLKLISRIFYFSDYR